MHGKTAADLVIALAWMWLGLLAIDWARDRWTRRRPRRADPHAEQRSFLSGTDPW